MVHAVGPAGLVATAPIYKPALAVYPSDVRSVPLAPAEERVLRKLLDTGPCNAAAVKPRPLATRLLELGLVVELPPARGRKAAQLDLSEDGRRHAEGLPPEKVTLADLYREIRTLGARVDALAASLGKQTALEEPPATVTPDRFEQELARALRELDRRGRHGGLVPLPELRRALAKLGMSRSDFDEALLERERAFSIDLKVAHDGRQLADASDALRDPARGLLYYVVLR